MLVSWSSWWCIGTVTAVAVVVGVTDSNTSCPTWFYYDNSAQQCKCGAELTCTSDSDRGWSVCYICWGRQPVLYWSLPIQTHSQQHRQC